MTQKLANSFDPSLRDLVAILWQRRGVAALTFVLVLVGSIGVIANWRFDYRASAEIGLASSMPPTRGELKDGGPTGQGQLTAQDIETVIAEIGSEKTLSTALSVLRGEPVMFSRLVSGQANRGLFKDVVARQSQTSPHPDETGLINQLHAGLKAERIGHSAVISVSFASGDPALSQSVLRAIVESYVWQREDRQKRSLRIELAEITGQFDRAQTELETSESDLSEWQQRAGVLDPDESKLMLDRIYALDEQAEKIGQDVAALKLAAIQRDGANRLEDLLTIPDVATHPMVAQLATRYDAQRKEFLALDQRYGPKHPLMQGKQRELDDLRAELMTVATSVADQMGSALINAQEKLYLIERQRDQWQARMSDRHTSMQGQAALVRAVAMARDNLQDLGQRVQGLRRELVSFKGDAEILRSPTLPVAAEFPARRDLLLLAVMVALFAAMIAALLRHYFDQTIGDGFEPESMLGIPLYARIPDTGPSVRTEQSSGASDEATGHLAVLMRLLDQKSDNRSERSGRGQVIAIASAQTGEGKSHIAQALAAKLAALGGKTVLVDADLHDPAMMRGHAGVFADLMPILSGDIAPEDVFGAMKDAPGYCHLGVRLAVPGNIATGLIENRLPAIIKALCFQFDHIIIDTPPVLSVADGLVALRLADVRLLVLRKGQSKRRDSAEALDQLRTVDVIPEGIVLNGVVPRPAYGKANTTAIKSGQVS
ncbi:GumC family protein [Thalassospira sp. SM2505]|uniref:Uncharacterized protein n=1 Tax=Thalassospira profundimaris TaxID=502049 RepID=A0A367WUE3_9PROT|nr:hypothetical protein [Thalassospira profundimaris]RCK45084.1 hypothetical protein TH30_13855 [Thalassospira profundimaris]